MVAVQPITFQPRTSYKIKLGAGTIVNAIRPTLGPLPRYVAIEGVSGVELLDDGGLIARRITELQDRDADVGAMFLRGVLWRLREEVGDGTATAAVLFQSVFDQALRYIAAGGNTMILRRHLERGMHMILDHLTTMTCPLNADSQKIAYSLCPDPEIAEMLHQIFERIGSSGRLEFRASYGRGVEWEFVEGAYWKADVHSSRMLHPGEEKIFLEDPAVLVTDLALDDLTSLIEVLKEVLQAGIKSLLIIAKSLSAQVAAFLNSNTKAEKFQGIAVHTPGLDSLSQKAALEGIAMLTGARPFFSQAGDGLNSFTLSDLGHAQRVWVGSTYFGIIGGSGDRAVLQNHICSLQRASQQSQTVSGRENLQWRAASLMDGGAVLGIGAASDAERSVRRQLAQRSAILIRAAYTDGVLPGGGISLLACRDMLQCAVTRTKDTDERAAYVILIRALEEPCRALAENAGYEASEILGRLQRERPGIGFDVRRGIMVELVPAGIVDVASVIKGAVHSAVAGAALALTIEAIIHLKKRLSAAEPD
jgi:chaperonin GroEL